MVFILEKDSFFSALVLGLSHLPETRWKRLSSCLCGFATRTKLVCAAWHYTSPFLKTPLFESCAFLFLTTLPELPDCQPVRLGPLESMLVGFQFVLWDPPFLNYYFSFARKPGMKPVTLVWQNLALLTHWTRVSFPSIFHSLNLSFFLSSKILVSNFTN